jgi:hypothetical protein
MSRVGTEKESENGCEVEVGAPVRPRPPATTGLPLEVLTADGFEDHAEIAGLVRLVARPADGPREGKASSEFESTGAEDEEEAPLALAAVEAADFGAGLLPPPRVGKGSGAPSSPCRYSSDQPYELPTLLLA